MNNEIIITERQKDIIKKLGDSLYTVDYVEEWINCNADISIDKHLAQQSMLVKGFYRAVLALEQQGCVCDEDVAENRILVYKVMKSELVNHVQGDFFREDFDEKVAEENEVIEVLGYFDDIDLAQKVVDYLNKEYEIQDWCDDCWLSGSFIYDEDSPNTGSTMERFEKEMEEEKLSCARIEIIKKYDDGTVDFTCTAQCNGLSHPAIEIYIEECYISKNKLDEYEIIKYEDYISENFSIKEHYNNHPYKLKENDLIEYKNRKADDIYDIVSNTIYG